MDFDENFRGSPAREDAGINWLDFGRDSFGSDPDY